MGAADKASDCEKNSQFIEELILIYERSNMCYEDGNIVDGVFSAGDFPEPADAGGGVQPDVWSAGPGLGNPGWGEKSPGRSQLPATCPNAPQLLGHQHQQHPQVGGPGHDRPVDGPSHAELSTDGEANHPASAEPGGHPPLLDPHGRASQSSAVRQPGRGAAFPGASIGEEGSCEKS